MSDRAVAPVTAVTRFGSKEVLLRGHEEKLWRIAEALKVAGQLPDGLRPVELRRRIFDKGLELGYSPSEIPSRTSIRRWRRKYKAANSSNTSNETSETRL